MTVLTENLQTMTGVNWRRDVRFYVPLVEGGFAAAGAIATAVVNVIPDDTGVITSPDFLPGRAQVRIDGKSYDFDIPDSPTPVDLAPLLGLSIDFPPPVVLEAQEHAMAAAASAAAAAASAGGGLRLTPEHYGAVGNGIANDTAALQDAFDDLAAGKTLYIDTGKVYAHNAVLTLTASGCTIRGGGEIRATAEATSAFIIQGDNVTIEDVLFSCPTTTTRGVNLEHHKVVVDNCVGTRLSDVRVAGAKGGGIKMQGAQYFHLDNCRVADSLADAFHTTHSSAHGVISNCRAEDCGDDGFSVVSYEADGTRCEDIVVHGFYVKNGGARGIAIVGATNIRYFDGHIDTTAAAAILVACEISYLTYGVSDVVIDTMHVSNANTSAPGLDHGAITVLNDRATGFDITGVTIRNVVVHNTDASASRQVGVIDYSTGDINNITLGAMTFTGTGPSLKLSTGGLVAGDLRVDDSFGVDELLDSNGNVILGMTPIASADNWVGVQNNTAGSNPKLYAAGSDTNINLVFAPKGAAFLYYDANTQTDAVWYVDGSSSDINWHVEPKGAGRLKTGGNVVVDRAASVPATATSAGKAGQIAVNGTHLYICTATNTWLRVAIATW